MLPALVSPSCIFYGPITSRGSQQADWTMLKISLQLPGHQQTSIKSRACLEEKELEITI